jgi:hypothetical protein
MSGRQYGKTLTAERDAVSYAIVHCATGGERIRPDYRRGDERFTMLTIGFNVTIAERIVADRPALLVPLRNLSHGFTSVDDDHVATVDPDRPGIVAELPTVGHVLIDGNHRAYRCEQLGRDAFAVRVLTLDESRAVCYTRSTFDRLYDGPLYEPAR